MSKPFRTIEDIKRVNAIRGDHFFDPDTMRWFRSRVHDAVYPAPGGAYFVTSEANLGWGIPREYRLRWASEDGNITTLQVFASRSGAHARAKSMSANNITPSGTGIE